MEDRIFDQRLEQHAQDLLCVQFWFYINDEAELIAISYILDRQIISYAGELLLNGNCQFVFPDIRAEVAAQV